MRTYLSWTPEELDYLALNYEHTSRDILQQNLRNRDTRAIIKKAQVQGLKKATTRLSNPSRLLEKTPEAFYWLGFLLADGGFTERRITLKVSIKDIDHLRQLALYIQSRNKIREKKKCCQLRVTDVKTVTELRKTYDITNRKTYHPCKIDQIENDDLLFSLIIGFIDGDGCVCKNKKWNSHRISVIGYHAWLSNFEYMEDNLRRIVGSKQQRSAKIRDHWVKLPQNKEKKKFRLASFYISDRPTLLAIQQKAEELKLPYMKRKLGKIIDSSTYEVDRLQFA